MNCFSEVSGARPDRHLTKRSFLLLLSPQTILSRCFSISIKGFSALRIRSASLSASESISFSLDSSSLVTLFFGDSMATNDQKILGRICDTACIMEARSSFLKPAFFAASSILSKHLLGSFEKRSSGKKVVFLHVLFGRSEYSS